MTMRNYLNLSHEDFVAMHKAGQVEIATNRNAAMQVCDGDTRIDRTQKFFFSAFKLASLAIFPTAIVLFFFITWYWALLIFILGLPMASRVSNYAAGVVARTCLKDESLYYDCIDSKIVRIFQK